MIYHNINGIIFNFLFYIDAVGCSLMSRCYLRVEREQLGSSAVLQLCSVPPAVTSFPAAAARTTF